MQSKPSYKDLWTVINVMTVEEMLVKTPLAELSVVLALRRVDYVSSPEDGKHYKHYKYRLVLLG